MNMSKRFNNGYYRLGELLKSKPIYGASLPALKTGKFLYFRQSDIKNKKPKFFVNSTNGKIMNNGDFFISRAGTILPYIHETDEKWVYAGYLIKYPLKKEMCIPKFIFYYINGIGRKQLDIMSKTGVTMPKMNPNVAKDIKILVP
ncbi:MAG: hypothetical protein E7Y34_02930, partial [Mycoplasma sp.]|nr:hypothetical protein [Mycoplasma sp.]